MKRDKLTNAESGKGARRRTAWRAPVGAAVAVAATIGAGAAMAVPQPHPPMTFPGVVPGAQTVKTIEYGWGEKAPHPGNLGCLAGSACLYTGKNYTEPMAGALPVTTADLGKEFPLMAATDKLSSFYNNTSDVLLCFYANETVLDKSMHPVTVKMFVGGVYPGEGLREILRVYNPNLSQYQEDASLDDRADYVVPASARGGCWVDLYSLPGHYDPAAGRIKALDDNAYLASKIPTGV